jgi:hypothetical protein
MAFPRRFLGAFFALSALLVFMSHGANSIYAKVMPTAARSLGINILAGEKPEAGPMLGITSRRFFTTAAGTDLVVITPSAKLEESDQYSMRRKGYNPDERNCKGIFTIGDGGDLWWRGCTTLSCQPDFGDCRKSNLDDGRFTCTCANGNAKSPYCQVAASVNNDGKVTGWECLVHACASAPCQDQWDLPTKYFPCKCM